MSVVPDSLASKLSIAKLSPPSDGESVYESLSDDSEEHDSIEYVDCIESPASPPPEEYQYTFMRVSFNFDQLTTLEALLNDNVDIPLHSEALAKILCTTEECLLAWYGHRSREYEKTRVDEEFVSRTFAPLARAVIAKKLVQ